MKSFLTFFTLLISSAAALADPRITSWFTDNSGVYARVYKTTLDQNNLAATTTWDHPTGTDQLTPTYAGIHEVSCTPDWIYIRTTNLASYIMGPWYLNAAKTNLFPNYPSNQAVLYRLPRNPANATNSLHVPGYTLTVGGAIGYFVDGVAMFDSRDAFSWSGTADAQPGLGAWNRDAYVNEGVTFDAGNAHQAAGRYHYHANPPGLRHLLGDSVAYAAATNTYTETPNGKHSPIIGWCRDGLPIYGPYGYSDRLNAASPVTRMRSGFQLRTDIATVGSARNSWPAWATRVYGATGQAFSNGPNVTAPGPPNPAYQLGKYMEDNDYKGDLGMTLGVHFDLNEYNARFCVTPEFPSGTWAYFTCIDANGVPVYPYNIGRSYFLSPVGNTATAIPAPGDAGPVTKHFEGGPEKLDKEGEVAVAAGSGDVTLTWSGVQGGRYEVDYSPNLQLWKSSGEMTANTSRPSMVDPGVANLHGTLFYRTRRVGMDAFDAAGFDYTPQVFPTLTTITVDITGAFAAPALLTDDPVSITFNGQTVIFVGRPAQNQVQFRVDLTGLADGDYPVVVTFAGASGTHTGTCTIGGGGPVTNGNNVLLLIVDDWGIDWSPLDNTSPGVTLPKMPTFESLAASGLRFTRAFAQPVCSPTRATILTGRHPFRHGVGNQTTYNELAASELALPEVFTAQSSPYGLASFGKWHLAGGNTGPGTCGGWPYFKGSLIGGLTDYNSWTKTQVINGVASQTTSTTYATTEQVDDAVSWITAQGANPWFCWIGFNAPHSPFHAPPAGLAPPGGYTAGTGNANADMYRNMLEALDTEMGRLLQSVNLSKTNVIIIGDNGSPGQVAQAPFSNSHAKDSLYMGGVNVPLVISGPDVTVPGGSTSSKLVHCVDLFSTILQLGGIDTDAATTGVTIDSKTLVPILRGTDTLDRIMVAETFGNGPGEGRAIISDDYPDHKLVILGDRLSTTDTPTFEFYNIDTDFNEQSPLNIAGLLGIPLDAYNHLIAKDAALGGGYSDPSSVVLDTLYIELPATGVAPAVPGLTNPGGGTISVTSVTVNGNPATYVARVNSGADLANEGDDVASQYWVKVTITPSGPYTTAHVVFPNTPGGAAREYDSINTILVKP